MSADGLAAASSSSTSRTLWVVGVATTAAVGLGCYWAYSRSGSRGSEQAEAGPRSDDKYDSSVASQAATARLRIARAMQMQALGPRGVGAGAGAMPRAPPPARASAQPPVVRQTPKANGGAGASSRKVCSLCGAPTPPGLPLRCSGCKLVYYCSQGCQRKAWPDHKGQCKSLAAGAKPGQPQAAGAGTSASTSAASQQQEPQGGGAGTSAKGGSGGGAAEEPKTFQDALAMYLEQNAATKSDALEASFEVAIMQFVKGEYPAAISQLQKVQAIARERGDWGVEGEAFKWLGHAHSKMGDVPRAEQLFQEGIDFASKHSAPRLEIECLGGLGCMLKAQDKTAQSVALLRRALELSEGLGDADSRASALCNLGAALMQTSSPEDSNAAMGYLRQAVKIREQAVERLHAAGERSGLATAVMEHAHTLVHVANALYVRKEFEEAKAAYEQSLEVFEMVQDADKVSKVLVNLANMCEMQIKTPASRRQAAEYRARLAAFLEASGLQAAAPTCPVCHADSELKLPTTDDDKELIMLSCAHCLHNKCWEGLVAQSQGSVACPTCHQPVPVLMVQ